MSTLHHESLYETCFDESFDEYMRISGLTGDQMSEWVRINPFVLDRVEDMAYKKFQAMCQLRKWHTKPPHGGFFVYYIKVGGITCSN